MRVLLADDEAKVRSALKLLLEQQPDLSIVGEAGNVEMLFHCLESNCDITSHDVLILDWELPGFRSGGQLSALRNSYPYIKVVALSCLPDARKASILAGADAFVSKNEPPDRILTVIEEIAGQNPSSPA